MIHCWCESFYCNCSLVQCLLIPSCALYRSDVYSSLHKSPIEALFAGIKTCFLMNQMIVALADITGEKKGQWHLSPRKSNSHKQLFSSSNEYLMLYCSVLLAIVFVWCFLWCFSSSYVNQLFLFFYVVLVKMDILFYSL